MIRLVLLRRLPESGPIVSAWVSLKMCIRDRALAKSQSPRLSAVQLTANGGLRGLGEVESQTDADEDGEAGINLIAQLLRCV